MPGYFWDGFLHFSIAVVFTVIFIKLTGVNNLFKNIWYLIGLIFTSSSLFFLPSHISNSWLDKVYQFSHYPLPDWDILLLGAGWHRFFMSHSFLIPFILIIIFINKRDYEDFILGTCVGLGSHLFWDGLSCSMKTPVVFIAKFAEIRGYEAKSWLIVNGIMLFFFAYYLWHKRSKSGIR